MAAPIRIEDVNFMTSQIVVAELGTELGEWWPTEQHFASKSPARSAYLLAYLLAYWKPIREPSIRSCPKPIFRALIGLRLKSELHNNRQAKCWARPIAAELCSDAGTAPKSAGCLSTLQNIRRGDAVLGR
jgi:hypothetical protein